MIIGAFGEKTGRPYVPCRLWIPRLNLVDDIFLCVDTGSDKTTLMPPDCRALGLERLTGGPAIGFAGVGGNVDVLLEPAWFVFEDGEDYKAFETQAALVFEEPGAELRPLPSLLGRDILHRMRIDYQFSAGRLQFEVESVDVVAERTSPIRPPVTWLD